MGNEYDIMKPGDMRRFQRDLEKETTDIVREVARGAQHAGRIRCSVHGEYTQVRETDSVGGFEITSNCCDEVVELAYAAVERYPD
jgi:hypothetical protein